MDTQLTTAAATTGSGAAHNGIPPAAAMLTPFDLPCGVNFLDAEFHRSQHLRDVCGPPGFDDYWWSTVGYYSPAVCPRGYTAGCFRWHSSQGPPVEPTETAVQCVPRGYKCRKDDVSVAFSGTATAPMIQIRWAETDLSTLATHPLYPGANPTNTDEDYLMKRTRVRAADLQAHAQASGDYYPDGSAVGGGSPSRPTTTSTSGSDSSGGGNGGSSSSDDGFVGGGGLSTGAKIGIGVGVAFSALLGFTVLGLIIWRLRAASKRARQHQQPAATYMVPSKYANQPGPGPPPVMAGAPMTGGPERQQYSGVQQPQPAYQPQSTYPPQHQAHPSVLEMDNAASAANNKWAGGSVTAPPAVASVAPPGSGPSTISSPAPPTSELESVRTPNPPVELASDGPFEMGGGTPAARHTQPATVEPPSQTPSTQELSSLQEQHAQLEQRRQRILELERIEREQEALRSRMGGMQGGGGGSGQG